MSAQTLLLMLGLAFQDTDRAVQRDLAAMQGDWHIVWITRNGQKIDVGERGSVYTVRGSAWYVGDELISRFKIDPTCSPKLIDFMPPSAQDQSQVIEGIYRLDGDDMIWCWNVREGVRQRPAEIRAEGDSDSLVYAFRRKK